MGETSSAAHLAARIYCGIVYACGLCLMRFAAIIAQTHAPRVGRAQRGDPARIDCGDDRGVAITLSHWIALASLDPTLWRSAFYIAAPAIAGS